MTMMTMKDFIKRKLIQLGIKDPAALRPKNFVNKQLNRHGYYKVPRLDPLRTIEEFHSYAVEIRRNSRQQILEEATQLRKKCEEPIFGNLRYTGCWSCLRRSSTRRWNICTALASSPTRLRFWRN